MTNKEFPTHMPQALRHTLIISCMQGILSNSNHPSHLMSINPEAVAEMARVFAVALAWEMSKDY